MAELTEGEIKAFEIMTGLTELKKKIYVDRRKLILDFYSSRKYTDYGEYAFEIISRICAQPAADVVEVVRCKNCKWWEKGKDYTPYCNNIDCGLFYTARENDFCSYGERKENAT